MTRFILRALLGVPIWLLYIVIQLPLMAIGFPLVAVLAAVVQFQSRRWTMDRRGLLHFPRVFGLRLFYLWDNDEDGIDGDPITGDVTEPPKNEAWFEATAHWPVWRRVFVWSAWRNSVGNARRLPFLGMDITDPKAKVTIVPPRAMDYMRGVAESGTYQRDKFIAWWNEYRKLGPYLTRYGYRFELKFPWPAAHTGDPNTCANCTGDRRYFWIGWRIAQQDKPNTDIGFAFQPWAKL